MTIIARVKTSTDERLIGIEVPVKKIISESPKSGRDFYADLTEICKALEVSYLPTWQDYCLERGCRHIDGDWEIIEKENA